MKRPAHPTLLAVATVLAATGCGTTTSHRDASTTPTPPSATNSAGPGVPPQGVHRAVTHVRVAGRVGPLALDGTVAALPFGTGENWNRVGLLPAGASQVVPVAASRWPHGLINFVGLAGDWVGYVDQSAPQSDASPDVRWAVRAVNVRTHRSILLASSGETPDPYVPLIRSGAGYLAWTSANPDTSAKESIWRPGWRRPRVLLPRVEMTPGSETLAAGRLVYLGPNGKGLPGHTTGGDCWSVPLTGGRPTALTHTALAMDCATSAEGLVWTQHIDPATRPLPVDGILEDPYTVWHRSYDDGSTTRLHQGYSGSAAPLAGADVAAWQQGHGFRLWTGSRTPPRQVRADQAALSGPYLATARAEGTGTIVEVTKLLG